MRLGPAPVKTLFYMLLGAALTLTFIAYGLTPWSIARTTGPSSRTNGTAPQSATMRRALDYRSPLERPSRPTADQTSWSVRQGQQHRPTSRTTGQALYDRDSLAADTDGQENDLLQRLRLLCGKLLGQSQEPSDPP